MDELIYARSYFFRRWRSEQTQRLFLQNEARILEMMDPFSLRQVVRNLSFNMPLPTNWNDPVTVAPTSEQMNRAFETVTSIEGSCPICQENYTSTSDVIRLRNCRHCFHRDCARDWYTVSVRCPMCRDDIRNIQNNGNGGVA
jgi:hypothetical protein